VSANNAVAGSKPRGGGFGAAGGGYQNTEIGQIIVLAYLDAYKKLVTQLGGQPVTPAAAPAQLLAIPRAGPLPSGRCRATRRPRPRTRLRPVRYPHLRRPNP